MRILVMASVLIQAGCMTSITGVFGYAHGNGLASGVELHVGVLEGGTSVGPTVGVATTGLYTRLDVVTRPESLRTGGALGGLRAGVGSGSTGRTVAFAPSIVFANVNGCGVYSGYTVGPEVRFHGGEWEVLAAFGGESAIGGESGGGNCF